MTRSVPGGQRGSSKDPAETSALWGNNSATFHHFIIMSLYWTQLRTHEAHEGKDRKWATEKHEERGVYRGTRGSWSFKQGEVWIMKFKKVSHNNGLIPTYETNKKQTDQRTQQKRENKQKTRLMLKWKVYDAVFSVTSEFRSWSETYTFCSNRTEDFNITCSAQLF